MAQTYLQLPLQQWGASNVYLLVLSSWKVNIGEHSIAIMGLLLLICLGIVIKRPLALGVNQLNPGSPKLNCQLRDKFLG